MPWNFPAAPTLDQEITFPEGPTSYKCIDPTAAAPVWDRKGAAATPPPLNALTITALSPDTSPVGELRLTMTITGTRFSSASAVNWDGRDIPTTFVSATTLTASVNPALVPAPRAVPVFVKDGTDVSNTVNFTFTAALAVLTSIAPTSGRIGGPAIQAKAYGTGFNANTVVLVSGSTSNTNTVLVSPTELNWTITCQFETTPRTAQVTLNFGSGSVPLEYTATTRAAPAPPPRPVPRGPVAPSRR